MRETVMETDERVRAAAAIAEDRDFLHSHHRDIAYPHDPQLGFRAISVGLAGITALDGSIVHPGLYETDDIDLSRDTSATRDVVL
jgi:hypothetical protein